MNSFRIPGIDLTFFRVKLAARYDDWYLFHNINNNRNYIKNK